MKKLSLKGLADFMTAPEAKRRKILHQFKYPDEDESKAKIIYYREAKERIIVHHRGGQKPSWLLEEASRIDDQASLSIGQTKIRLKHNARSLHAYTRNFACREFDVLDDARLALLYGDVRISIFPDLHVREKGKEKIIKFEFNKDAANPELVKIVSQCMYEASEQAGMALSAANVLLFDVAQGQEHRGAKIGARMRSNIEAACLNISAIWDGI